MTAGRDDAFSWDGDDDPTLVTRADDASVDSSKVEQSNTTPREATGAAAPEPVALPRGYDAVGRGADDVGRLESDGTVTPATHAQPLGNAALIGIGILSGIYLLWTVGWVVGGLRLQGVGQNDYLRTDFMFQGSFWLAVVAPAIWFLTTLVLTRRRKTWLRVLWLIAGVVLLVPWPFLMVGAVGQ